MNGPDLPNENFVAAWRERKGWTQAKLGEEIGTTGSVVSLLESGDRQLSPKWLRKIAAAFQIPTGYLLEHHPDEVPADVLEAWAGIPKAKQGDALAMLRALAVKTGTDG
jgi:transcriptional regulator with XRE-family HTH domain